MMRKVGDEVGEKAAATTLDQAILECETFRRDHRTGSILILTVMGLLAFIVLSLGGTFLKSSELLSPTPFQTSLISGALVVFSIVVAVLVSFYRHHLQEIAKFESFKIDFIRIRVAAANGTKKFDTEVRTALTTGTFQYEPSRKVKAGRLQSPAEGHPTSDLSTAVINKLLDGVEFVAKARTPITQEALEGKSLTL